MSELTDEALEHIKKIRKSEFQWILIDWTELPDWLPNPLIQEFRWTVPFLLLNCEPDDLIKYFDVRSRLIDTDLRHVQQVPAKYSDKIDALIYINRLINLDKEDGLLAYLGEGGSNVYRGIVISNIQSDIASKPRSDMLNKVILGILEKMPSLSWKQVLQTIESLANSDNEDAIILSVNETDIEWFDKKGKVKKSPISGLSKRVSKLKKQL